MHKHPNTFDKGLNTDISDLVMPSNMMRNCKNMRMLDLDGTSYAVTTIRGTEQKFTLSPGYFPIASIQYNDVLYIMSGTDKVGVPNEVGNVEIGSYPSPVPTVGGLTNDYRPFLNMDDGATAFNVDIWNLKRSQFVDLSVQPEYDGSVNIIVTAEDNPPRLINSRFNKKGEIVERREGANTNDYTSASVDEETRIVLRSQQIMNVAYGAVESGGKLQPGNYVYIFKYATADFNETDVVNQSSICSVFEGFSETTNAASVNVETTKRVRLTLSNVDTDFAYLKVYFKYNRGDDSNIGNVYELTQPIAINSDSFDFIHDGFESTVEVSEDSINLDFTAFDSVATHTQVNSYLILGNVKEAATPYEELAAAAQTVSGITWIQFLAEYSPYSDPANVYNYMGGFSGETYPYGIVFVLNDGSTTPVFPIQGRDNVNWANLTPQQQDDIKAKGLYRFETIESTPFYNDFLSVIQAKGIQLNLANIPQSVKDQTLGFFIVRGERKPDLLSQGILIPTLRVPPFDFTKDPQIDNINDGNYYDVFSNEDDYKNFPVLDNLLEAWARWNQAGGDDQFVIKRDGTNRLDAGYMPILINNVNIGGGAFLLKNPNAWAYYSADYLLNEARYITALQRSNVGYTQWNHVSMRAVNEGLLKNKWKNTGLEASSTYGVDASMLYEFERFTATYNGNALNREIDSINYVPPSTFATGHKFISAISSRFRQDGDRHFQVRSLVDGYFGIIANVEGAVSTPDAPYNQPVRARIQDQTEGPAYANVNSVADRAYLISIYPRLSGGPIDDINQIYDTIDGIAYHQVSDRIAWADAGPTINVYGGDCYIGKVYKKLHRSGYNDPKEPSEVLVDPAGYQSNLTADNINQGLTFSFLQESEYNPSLRLPYLAVTSEPEKRTFFPYRNPDDINTYRSYRLPETNKTNQGHVETERPKSFIPIPSNAPFIASHFFTRLIHSEKHVPNAFQNGYRSFIGINHEDYDPDMGEVVRLFTHRDQVFVVFEHGIGIGPVSQRIQTGSDSAGAIFVEPSGVLPPNLGFASREIGAQDGNAMIQTASSIYGIDQQRKKIWQFREGLLMISDMGMQQLMEKSNLSNPRLGYDPHYHEVIFTTDDWTLCFKEGLEAFTSFYSFQAYQYARKGKGFYSFNSDTDDFQLHNVNGVRTIYGNIEESYVEIVVNPSANSTKVFDYLNIVSNEISPKRIDLYTYNVETYKEDVLNEANMFQHAVIEQGIDFFTEEERIRLRDRKFVAQIPHVSYINDVEWGEGRLRNKYVIIRLTYETDQKVEILSLITDFRISAS